MEWSTCALLVTTWPVSRIAPVELVGDVNHTINHASGSASADTELPLRRGSDKTMMADDEEKRFDKHVRAAQS